MTKELMKAPDTLSVWESNMKKRSEEHTSELQSR